ncbi:MAG: DEAD/DEAH box helicase [Lentisphaerae bacterium]|nr:DEAD/DEAH box helicase [Lentisphaerota bacterium]
MIMLRPYQTESINKIAEKNGRLLVNAPCGSGKTFIALYLRKQYPGLKKVLIICPASVKLQWAEVIKETFPSDTVHIAKGAYKNEYAHNIINSDFVIINYDILFSRNAERSWTDMLKRAGFTLMVVDESHNLANKESNRSQCVHELAKEIKYRILLTATPITSNISGLWGQLHILDPLEFTSLNKFLNYFAPPDSQTIIAKSGKHVRDALKTFQPQLNKFLDYCTPPVPQTTIAKGGKCVRDRKPGAVKHLDELQGLIREYCYVISPDEVYKHLAGVQRINVPCVVESKRVSDMLSKLKRHSLSNSSDEKKAKELLASTRMELGKAKVDAGVAWIKDWLNGTDEKIVVFAYHRSVVELTAERLGNVAVKFYGGMSTTEKNNAVNAFVNNPDVRVIVMNMAACTGVDGLQLARACFYMENTSLASLYQQSEGRIRRTNSTYDAYFAYRLVADVLDPQILSVMNSRWEMTDAIMTGGEITTNGNDELEVIKRLQKGE